MGSQGGGEEKKRRGNSERSLKFYRSRIRLNRPNSPV